MIAMHSITAYTPDPDCPKCLGDGLVCEDHPDHVWDGACCGGAGMPCDCIVWVCGSRGRTCACGKPSWYTRAKDRAIQSDRLGYWCGRVVESIDRGDDALIVTPAEYQELRAVLFDEWVREGGRGMFSVIAPSTPEDDSYEVIVQH